MYFQGPRFSDGKSNYLARARGQSSCEQIFFEMNTTSLRRVYITCSGLLLIHGERLWLEYIIEVSVGGCAPATSDTHALPLQWRVRGAKEVWPFVSPRATPHHAPSPNMPPSYVNLGTFCLVRFVFVLVVLSILTAPHHARRWTSSGALARGCRCGLSRL